MSKSLLNLYEWFKAMLLIPLEIDIIVHPLFHQ